jgi:carbonic anhydrase
MKKLISGLQTFRASYVSTHRDLLEQLKQGQTPRVLFITCSDSRIDPNLLTQTDIGELFVIRNAGNIIPPYGAANGGEGATIEYAIHALGIKDIVICGHSHCGAMKGLLQLGRLEEQMPLVYEWLKHTEATRRLVSESYSDFDGEELLEITIAENVITQIENLKTYPIVHSRLHQGKLNIYGWIYMIETGEVLAYDPVNHVYIPPQSQIVDVDSGDGFTPRQYVRTQAPGVACELPPVQLDVTDPQPTGQPLTVAHASNGASLGQPTSHQTAHQAAHQNVKPITSDNWSHPWLPPEQAERIYRGSGSR